VLDVALPIKRVVLFDAAAAAAVEQPELTKV
jgi:hypothetical protein